MISKYAALLRFELNYQLKSWTVPLLTLGYFGFAFLLGSQGTAPAGVNYNSDYELFVKMGLLSLGSVFSIIFFVLSAIHRDRIFSMEALIYSTPVSKFEFYLSRFLGAWIIAVAVLLFATLGFYAGIYFSDLDPGRIGQFSIISPISLALMLLIPSVTICTVLIFTVSLHSRNTMATYAMAFLIYGAYFISAIFLNSPLIANSAPVSAENLFIAGLADPFGLSAFFEQTNLWTPFQKNGSSISFTGLLAWNRIVWMLASVLLMSFSYWKFSFRKQHLRTTRKIKAKDITKSKPAIFQNVIPKIGGYFQVIPSSIKLELSYVLKSIPFWIVTGSWIIIATTEIFSKIYSGGEYGESYFPASQILLEQVQDPLYKFCLVLLVFFTGELFWRAKESNFQEIIGATPAPGGYFFISTWTTLVVMIGVMVVATVSITFGYQLIQGFQSPDSLTLLAVTISPGISLLFYTLLMLTIHHWSRNKYLGMSLSVLAVGLFSTSLGSAIGINHPLLKIGSTPLLVYSQQAGFGLNSKTFWLLSLLWMILGLIISINLFTNWKGSLQRISSNSTRKLFSKLIIPIVLFLVVGCFSFYQINMVEGYQSKNQLLDEKHQYELTYKKYQGNPVLSYSSLDLEVDLFPSKNVFNANVRGKLKNVSRKPIRTLLVTEVADLDNLTIQSASKIQKDEKLGVYLVQFDDLIQVGQELAFSFEVHPKSILFEEEKLVLKEGTYLNFLDFAPYFGYVEGRELNDNQERKKRNLPIKSLDPGHQDHPELERNLIKVDFSAKVSTEFPQIAITSGNLSSVVQKGSRTSYEYKSDLKILPSVAFFSGNYTVDSLQADGVNFQVYSISAHRAGSDQTLKIMEKTLKYASKNFGPYPFNHIKIVEIPGHWRFGGFAHPGVISMVEDKFFLVKSEPKTQFDLKAKRTIHEVAHQWFGHMLSPRNVPGASIFVEGLAKYTEALVMEKEIGKAALWHLTDNANKTYFTGRAFATEREPTLAQTDRQSYLAFGKSLLSLLSIRDIVGEEKLNGIIREMISSSVENPEPKVIMQGFLEQLISNSTQDQINLITESFLRIIHYDIEISEVVVEQLTNGKYEIKVSYLAKKLETLTNGEEIEIPMEEKIILGAFTSHPKNLSSPEETLYSEKVSIQSGKGSLSIILDQKPHYIALDPWGYKPDANRRDNIFNCEN